MPPKAPPSADGRWSRCLCSFIQLHYQLSSTTPHAHSGPRAFPVVDHVRFHARTDAHAHACVDCESLVNHRSCRNRRRRMPSDADRAHRMCVDGSARRCSGEPQRADRWATTADSVRGADDPSTVGCRVHCAPRECRTAGGRDSIGLQWTARTRPPAHTSRTMHVRIAARFRAPHARWTIPVVYKAERQLHKQSNKSCPELVPLCQN